jgi:hypothetical protein
MLDNLCINIMVNIQKYFKCANVFKISSLLETG